MNYKIRHYKSIYKNNLIDFWGKSVLATHDFLNSKDFLEINKMLQNFDFDMLNINLLIHEEQVIGFQDLNIQMLFIHPDFTRKDLENQSVQFPIKYFKIDAVNLNEQNPNAVAFYEKFDLKFLKGRKRMIKAKMIDC